ncbi:type II secretion system F family protein [Streptomonospora salina]|nr:type II secretion system F family protein [Streptomonospora salina]
MPTGMVAAAAGGLGGAGTVMLAYAASRHRTTTAADARARLRRAVGRRWGRAVAAAGAGAATGAATGWVAGAVMAAAGAWWLPRLLGPDTATIAEAESAEAVATWAQQLRDLMAASAGLHQAVLATAPVAPAPIRAEVAALGRRLRSGVAMDEAMGAFARKVDNPTADLVAVALSSAEGRHAADLGALLGRLAEASRDRATMLVRTSAGRARVRASVRIIAAMSLLMVAGLVAFNRTYLAPFDTLTGQIVLSLVGALWAVAFVWLARLTAPVAAPRLLARTGGDAG